MAKREHVLVHPSQLRALASPFRSHGRGRLLLEGPMASHELRSTWERELNRNYYACGCDTGATGVLLGLLLGTAAAIVSHQFGRTELAAACGLALCIAILGGVVGKIIGKARARARLLRTIDEIVRSVPVTESQPRLEPTCG